MSIPITHRGRMTLERRIIPARDGLFALAQTFTGTDTRTLVTHNAFVLSQVEVLEGSLFFLLNSERVEAPNRFLLVVPSRAVLPMAFDRARVWTEGVMGFSSLTINVPALFESGSGRTPLDLESVRSAVCAPLLQDLDPDVGVAPAIVRSRRLLHELIAHPAPLRETAKQVGICPETLSRRFCRLLSYLRRMNCSDDFSRARTDGTPRVVTTIHQKLY